MKPNEKYVKAEHCYDGVVDGYGFAFVPGSPAGVVILDLRSRDLLNNLGLFQNGRDEKRIELLLQYGLIQSKITKYPTPTLDHQNVKSIGVWLHISNVCNLDCPGCYIVGKGKEYMSVAVAEKFIEKLDATVQYHQLKSIELRLAGGEPLTNKEMIYWIVREMKKRFTDRSIKTRITVITNGTLLTSQFLAFLAETHVGLSISLDGTREWNNKVRFFKNHRGAFHSIYRGITLSREFGFKPNILSTITADNIDGLLDLGELLIEMDLPFRFGVYRDGRGGYNGYRTFIEKIIPILNAFYDRYAEAIRSGRTTMMHQLADIHINKKLHLRGCNIGYSGVTVNHNGDVFLCQAAMDRNPIGNLWDDKTLLEMAWSQNTLPELSGTTALDYPGCNKCQWLALCGGGCPLINASANGSAATKSPYCYLFQAIIPRLIELKALSNIQNLKLVSEKGG